MHSLLSLTSRYLSRFIVHKQSFALFPSLQVKQIIEEKHNNELVIQGVSVPSGREPLLLHNDSTTACAVCNSGLDIKHTDVLILSQFLRSNGTMLPRRVTGLCRKQQKLMSTLVIMAHKAGLMPNLNPSSSKNDPKKRRGWKKLNKYFDESTIVIKGRW